MRYTNPRLLYFTLLYFTLLYFTLVVPRASRKTGYRAFSVDVARAWNQLPTNLKLLRSTASFKNRLKSFLFHAAYRDWSSGQSYSFCTPLTCCSWWSATTDSSCLRGRHSDLRVLQTRRFCRALRESVRLRWWGFSLDGIQSAAAESRQDWSHLVLIVTSTTSDQIWSPVRIGSTDVQPVCSIRDLGSTSTLTWPWGPTSQPSSERASGLYDRSGACGDLSHVMPCWPWFVHWLSARWSQLQDQ